MTISGPKTRRFAFAGAVLVPVAVVGAMFIAGIDSSNSGPSAYPNLSLNDAAVTCATAHDVDNAFTPAVHDATQASPDYSGVVRFGFRTPVNPAEIAPLRGILTARLAQIESKVQTVDAGNCTDRPTASVTAPDGSTVTLPVVYDNQPDQPLSGSQSNMDPRTLPVTLGNPNNDDRTNTWSELDQKFGSVSWYTSCANDKLGMNWPTDVPKYEATEDSHDNRVIVAINTTWSDDQIRQKATDDGNPHITDKTQIVRTPSIINTRHLESTQCDPFVDARSQIRVSLVKPTFDSQGNWQTPDASKGIFVDCHNMWWLPPTPPVPTPGQPTPPGTTPPGTTPGTTPPVTTTTQPPGCTNGGTPPQCLNPKDQNSGANHQGNNPTQNQGQAPVPDPTAEPRPSNPTTTYQAPAPPPPPHTTTYSAPPVETTASGPPATGCVPPPGMTTC